MSTSLPTQNQWDWEGLGLKVKDIDVSGTADLTALKLANVDITATAAELNKLDDSAAIMTPAAGITSDADVYGSSVFQSGDLIITRILIDLTDLIGSTTDLDIIGKSAAASHIGQVTTALNGVIKAGLMTCLEVPAGAVTDIDLYSATVATGAENSLITDLTETALVTSGGAWASGTQKGMTTVPPANGYLYLTNGAAGVPGTFTAGKFLIELFGQAS